MKIVICGSISFAKEMFEISKQLEVDGHKVVLPVGIENYIDNDKSVENKWDKLENDVFKAYFEKIRNGDAILIINNDKNGIKNYIGGNSLIECAFAHVLDKKIYLLNLVPVMSYSEEIFAMGPIVLNGDVSKILD